MEDKDVKFYVVESRNSQGTATRWAAHDTLAEARVAAMTYARRFTSVRPFYVVEHTTAVQTVYSTDHS